MKKILILLIMLPALSIAQQTSFVKWNGYTGLETLDSTDYLCTGDSGLCMPTISGQSGKFLTNNGSALSWATIGGGTVTSVGISGANGIGVASSPVTTNGTIALSLGTITGATWHGTAIDLATYVTGQLPFANGGEQGADTTSARTGTMTVSMSTAVILITPTGNCTFNASGGLTGQKATFVVTTSGASSFNLNWNTNYKSTGTLATGSASGKIFTVSFVCVNGTSWYEIARTTAM